MKKNISVVVIIILLFNCAYMSYMPREYLSYEKTSPIVISTRVGESVDLEEREKFGLFRGVEDFRSAIFYEIPDGGYEVEIVTEYSKLRAANRDINAIPIIRDYVDRYEEIKDSILAFEKKWGIIEYDALGQPVTQDEISHVKHHAYACGCGGGGFLLGLVPSAALGYLVAGYEYEWHYKNLGVGVVTGIASLTAIVILSASLGNNLDRSAALKAIKAGRQPRVVED